MSNYKDLKTDKFKDNTDIVDSGTEGTKIALGTTAQRGSTQGQIRFNTTTALAEYYDGTQFKSIDSAPTVTSISPTSLGQSVLGSSQSIVITGTNFSNTVTVKIIGNDGTQFTPASTTRNSGTQVTITTPTNLTHTNEPYDIQITNSSALAGTLADALAINDTPVFSTGSGSLGTLADGGRASSNLTAISFSDEESTPTVSVTTGSIPAGLTLNSNGTFSGTANAVSSNTTSNFTVTATDGAETATRNYSITVNAPVITFATSSGSIGTINDADRGSYSFSAVTATVTSGTLSYAIQSGSLPSSLSLNTSNGAITGTLDAVSSDTTFTFTIRATTTSASVTSDREFTITVNSAPLVLSVSGNIYNGSTSNLTITCTGSDGTVDIVFKEGSTTHSTLSNQSLSSNAKTVAVPSAVYGQSVGDTISITVVDGSKTSNAITRNILGVPTGGSISSSGGFRIHTFTSSGTFSIPSGLSLATQYVVVAGGGGTGSRQHSGGGGGGGYRSSVSGESSGRGASAESIPTLGAGNYTVTIGGGGSSSNSGNNTNSGASNGGNSVFNNITSNGGGYGGTYNSAGNSGGCGGASGSEGGNSVNGGSGTSGQGFNGGDGADGQGGGSGGGGGGAGSQGGDGSGNTSAGTGGSGVSSSITGSSVGRAGGGGGGNPGGSGGSASSGGGNGANGSGTPTSGGGNTGGGAGGGGADNRGTVNGGSGIVIVRYQL